MTEDIVIMRGETVPLKIAVFSDKECTQPVTLDTGQKIVFGIKKNVADTQYIICKELTPADLVETYKYEFRLKPSDTADLAYGEYAYDYGIQYSEDDFRPCVSTGKFIIVSSASGVIAEE